MTPRQTEVRITIRSRFDELDLVDSVAEAVLHFLHFGSEVVERISLAVREAAANAIQHGNGPESDEPVSIRFGLEGRELTIEVQDGGAGFDPDSLPDPLAPENLLNTGGRGILLMRSFMDDVAFSFQTDAGTLVTLRKQLPTPPEDGTHLEETE
jgi:serine/threonine-protein kinase RsbW